VPGADGISADLVLPEKSLTFTILMKFFWEIWISENMLEAWKTSLILRLAKEGKLADCNNWRGVTLLSRTSKEFSKVVQELFTANLENHIGKEKAGFHKGRCCSDLISTLMHQSIPAAPMPPGLPPGH